MDLQESKNSKIISIPAGKLIMKVLDSQNSDEEKTIKYGND